MTRARKTGVLGATVVVLLVAGVLGLNVLADRPPSFRRGGDFLSGTAPENAAALPSATTATTSLEQVTARRVAEAPAVGSARQAPSAPPASRPPVAAPSAKDDRAPVSQSPVTTAPSGPAPGLPHIPARPAQGTYTYAVDGEEGASVYGSRRFPERMTLTVHAGSGLAANQLAFDFYYSEDHAERVVLGYRGDGLFLDYEAGSIRFGPSRGEAEVDFDPPMCLIPTALRIGATRNGTSQARGADGSVARTEEWKVGVIGRERVTVGTTSIDAWKVQLDRRTTSGKSDKVTVRQTSWYDADRGVLVRFDKTVHAERQGPGVTLTYDSQATATLVDLSPATGQQ